MEMSFVILEKLSHNLRLLYYCCGFSCFQKWNVACLHSGCLSKRKAEPLNIQLRQKWLPHMRGKWVKVVQSCPTFCDPMDCSPSGSSACEILQARILERVAIAFSKVSHWLRNQTQVSCIAGRFFTIWVTREVWWAHWNELTWGHDGAGDAPKEHTSAQLSC